MALALYNKHNRQLDDEQRRVFSVCCVLLPGPHPLPFLPHPLPPNPSPLLLYQKALHRWRDQIARAEDESIRYVLPDHMLFELAEYSPRDSAQVLACCQPTPPLVRMHVHAIVDVIQAARSNADAASLPTPMV